jgi:hypothetical protein
VTTTYTGATDAEAIETLARLPGVRVKVSYDARRTRLHAKAWLFSRASGLDTAYVGSANLSQAALFGGHEWMVKASASDLPAAVEKFRGTFETLWNDAEFEVFDPARPEDCARLRSALARERGGGLRPFHELPTFFTLAPYPFQREILERLEAERLLHGRMRNLVVAATGTGKTVVAAFDFQRRIGPDGICSYSHIVRRFSRRRWTRSATSSGTARSASYWPGEPSPNRMRISSRRFRASTRAVSHSAEVPTTGTTSSSTSATTSPRRPIGRSQNYGRPSSSG